MQRTVLQSDDRSDDPRRHAPRRMELFTGAPGRRRWPDALKALIVLESRKRCREALGLFVAAQAGIAYGRSHATDSAPI